MSYDQHYGKREPIRAQDYKENTIGVSIAEILTFSSFCAFIVFLLVVLP